MTTRLATLAAALMAGVMMTGPTLAASNEAQALKMHPIIIAIGEMMERNLVCKTGGPISFADFPLDPDIFEFVAGHRSIAHKWAMEGVRNTEALVQQHGVAAVCAESQP